MTAVRDPEQPMRALNHANDVRLHVAGFKRELAGLATYEAIVKLIETVEERHGDPLLGSAKVRHLLLSLEFYGATKVSKILQVAQIANPDKRLRDLTARQRVLLVELLQSQGLRWRR